MLGFIGVTGGSVSVFGHPAGDREVRRRVGYLPENMRLHGFLKGREFLDFAGKLYGMPKDQRRTRTMHYLDALNMLDAAERPLREYSKGMLQRIGIAQALIHDPELLLFDEPTSGLDPIGTKEVRDIILSERDKGKTIFINSHLLSEIERTCDRVAILNKGLIVKKGRLEELSSKVPSVRVEVAKTSKATAKALGEAAKDVQIDGNVYVITPKDDEAKGRIPEILIKSGDTMVSMTESRESLEDIFYRIIKEEG
jgi:ABC-2 type transport system ATP-binding protein